MKIKPAKWGIAYKSKNGIEINPVLKAYQNLYKETLKHELGHTNKNMDFMHDLKDIFKFSKERFKFGIQHPIISLQSLAPIWYDEGWNRNTFMIAVWSLLIIETIGIGVLI